MSDEILTILKSIDSKLNRLLSQSPEVASDRDLDSPYGDPVVRIGNLRDWTGEPMKGRKYSECPSEFLDILASTLEYFAGKSEANGDTLNNGRPRCDYERKDAARARGWSRRNRQNPPKPKADSEWGGDNESPF